MLVGMKLTKHRNRMTTLSEVSDGDLRLLALALRDFAALSEHIDRSKMALRLAGHFSDAADHWFDAGTRTLTSASPDPTESYQEVK